MADNIIARYGDKVRVVTRPPYSVIVQMWGGSDWRDMQTFHTISDDYAYSNAKEAAERRAKDQG